MANLLYELWDALHVVAVTTAKGIVAIMCQHYEHGVLWVVLGGYVLYVLCAIASISIVPTAHITHSAFLWDSIVCDGMT